MNRNCCSVFYLFNIYSSLHVFIYQIFQFIYIYYTLLQFSTDGEQDASAEEKTGNGEETEEPAPGLSEEEFEEQAAQAEVKNMKNKYDNL